MNPYDLCLIVRDRDGERRIIRLDEAIDGGILLLRVNPFERWRVVDVAGDSPDLRERYPFAIKNEGGAE